ncbi:MAG: glutamate racemase [Candidatus Gottesmanbacteria bacterium]
MDTRPIGILDSGSGGLSIWKAIISLAPHESTIYIGDHAHIPYSDKTSAFIRSRIVKLISQLIKFNCKLCVIACNTATVAGIDWYRKQFPTLPIIGVVPVIKTAAVITKTNHICILSTKFTAKSDYQKKLIQSFASDKHVVSIGSSTLVFLIESPGDMKREIQNELLHVFAPYKTSPIDVIVLGCTHYPFILDSLRELFDNRVSIIDSSEAVARQIVRILTNNNTVAVFGKPSYVFLTTGEKARVSAISSKLLKHKTVVEHILIS